MIKFLRLWRKPNPPPVVKEPVELRMSPVWDIDMMKWRANPLHVDYARGLFHDQQFNILLTALENSRPKHEPLQTDAIGVAKELGKRHGYDLAIAVLKSAQLDPPKKPSQPVEIEYSDNLRKQYGIP